MVEEIKSVKNKLIENQTKIGQNKTSPWKIIYILENWSFKNLFEQQNIKFDKHKP